MTYISDLQQYLDEKGGINQELVSDEKQFAVFLSRVVEFATRMLPKTLTKTDIECFSSSCEGIIQTAIKYDHSEIHWYCPVCENEGRITDWQGTIWDKRKPAKG
jgi:hypothetical protein